MPLIRRPGYHGRLMIIAVAAIQPGKHVAASANDLWKKMSHTHTHTRTQVEIRRQDLCANGRVHRNATDALSSRRTDMGGQVYHTLQ